MGGIPGVLLVKSNGEEEKRRILIPESLRSLLLNLTHLYMLEGHPGKLSMLEKLQLTFHKL